MTPSYAPRAWTFTARGSPQDVLTLNPIALPSLPPLPLPRNASPTEEWLLLKTTYVGLNPGSLYHMGLIPAWVRARVAIPEMDLSATVEDVWVPDGGGAAAGGAKPEFTKGDQVIAYIPGNYGIPTGTGALATHVAVPARYVIRRPEGVGAREAAGVNLVACTAWELLELAGVKEGDRVLINGASGGIGHLAVQMARNIVGKKGVVVGICSGRNAEMVRGLGADEVIDYTQHANLPSYLKATYPTHPTISTSTSTSSPSPPFTAILDTQGHQPLYTHSRTYLAPQGTYAATKIQTANYGIRAFLPALLRMKANELWPLSPWLGGTGRPWRSAAMLDPPRALKERVVRMLADGDVRLVVDSVWELEDALRGYDVLESGRARGKVLVKVDDEVVG